MKHTLIALSLCFLGAGCATTNTTATKGTTAPSKAVSNSDVIDLTWTQVEEAMSGGAVLVDVRDAASFAEGHIDGATNRMPNDRDMHVILYSNGAVDRTCSKEANKAIQKGYSNVSEFRDGYAGWLMLL